MPPCVRSDCVGVCILNMAEQMGHHLSRVDKSVRRKKEKKTAFREALLAERSQSVNLCVACICQFGIVCLRALATSSVCMCGPMHECFRHSDGFPVITGLFFFFFFYAYEFSLFL